MLEFIGYSATMNNDTSVNFSDCQRTSLSQVRPKLPKSCLIVKYFTGAGNHIFGSADSKQFSALTSGARILARSSVPGGGHRLTPVL